MFAGHIFTDMCGIMGHIFTDMCGIMGSNFFETKMARPLSKNLRRCIVVKVRSAVQMKVQMNCKNQWRAGDEIARRVKGRNGAAPHTFQFSFKVLEMCRKVSVFGSTQIYIYISVGYFTTFQ